MISLQAKADEAAPTLAKTLTVSAKPGAICRLADQHSAQIQGSPFFFATSVGEIHIHLVTIRGKSPSDENLHLLCANKDGSKDKREGHVSASDFKPLTNPAEEAAPLVITSNTGVLSAEKIDVTTATDADLERLGYPPRPDKNVNEGAYQKWLYIVTTPGMDRSANQIDTGLVHSHPTKLSRQSPPRKADGLVPASSPSPSSTTSQNWSGYVLQTNTDTYIQAQATFPVPGQKTPTFLYHSTRASEWVGIDGANIGFVKNDGDVIQNGIDDDTYLLSPTTQVVESHGWYEYFPAREITYGDLDVSQGDVILAETWISRNNGKIQGNWMIYNETKREVAITHGVAPSGTISLLNSAEFIVERSQINNNDTVILTDFGSTPMKSAIFATTKGGIQAFDASGQHEPGYYQLTMTRHGGNSDATIASAASTSVPGVIWFTWHAYQ